MLGPLTIPHEALPDSLLPRLCGACLAVRGRLGPGHSPKGIAEALIGELRGLGFQRIRPRQFSRCRIGPAGQRLEVEECLDLVVESRSVIELAHPASAEAAAAQLSAFEDRLTRFGWAEGLLVDFDRTDPVEGLWIARAAGDFLTPMLPERIGIN